jgi:hypothetical protein
MMNYLKARLSEVSTKFGAILTVVTGACGVANAYGQPWAYIAFGASTLAGLMLIFTPEKKAPGAVETAQKVATAAQDAANVVAS